MTITIGHATTLTELQLAAADNDTDTLRRFCQWNDSNGDWQDFDVRNCSHCGGEGCKECDGNGAEEYSFDFDTSVYMDCIEGWFADDSELPR